MSIRNANKREICQLLFQRRKEISIDNRKPQRKKDTKVGNLRDYWMIQQEIRVISLQLSGIL